MNWLIINVDHIWQLTLVPMLITSSPNTLLSSPFWALIASSPSSSRGEVTKKTCRPTAVSSVSMAACQKTTHSREKGKGEV